MSPKMDLSLFVVGGGGRWEEEGEEWWVGRRARKGRGYEKKNEKIMWMDFLDSCSGVHGGGGGCYRTTEGVFKISHNNSQFFLHPVTSNITNERSLTLHTGLMLPWKHTFSML